MSDHDEPSKDLFDQFKEGLITKEEFLELMDKQKKNQITYKVSEKGAVSFYGIRKMPITLYIQEIEKIKAILNSDKFDTFVADNKKSLSVKN